MPSLAHVTLVVVLGAVGWFGASRLRIPSPAMLGPMVLVGAASCLGTTSLSSPSWVKLVLQIVIGMYVGTRVSREALAGFRSLLRPIGLATLWSILSALLIGYLLARAGGLDMATSFLGTTPGGIAEMSAMAMSVRASVSFVATLQALRIFTTMLVFPLYVRHRTNGQPERVRQTGAADTAPVSRLAASTLSGKRQPWVVSLAIGAVGGIVFSRLGVPAAGVVGATVAIAAVQAAGLDFRQPPAHLRSVAQAGLGILIGLTLGRETVIQVGMRLPQILLATAATLASSLLLARVVQEQLRTDVQTAFLACAPAGVTQMAVIAEELDAEVFLVSVFQLARLLSAILVLPVIIRMLI